MTRTGTRRLLLLHAHPDDESITTGGTMARYAAEGAEVTLVTCTLGEQGEIIPPDLDALGAWAGDQLGGYRAGELSGALAALGGIGHRYLGGIGRWRDSGMAGTPDAEHPRAFVRGAAGEQAAQLAELLDELRPQVVVTYDAHGGYGHPDHIRAHEIATKAAAEAASVARVFHVVAPASGVARGVAGLRQHPELPFRLPADGELPTVADGRVTSGIDISEHLGAKIEAMRAHRTQISVCGASVSPPYFALSNGIAQPVLDTEYFELAAGDGTGADTDLFGGLA